MLILAVAGKELQRALIDHSRARKYKANGKHLYIK